MQHNYWIYLFIMFAVTYLVRVLPLVVFKKKITNRFVRSFLTYIPYAVLAAMTFPAVFFAVDCIPAAAAGVAAKKAYDNSKKRQEEKVENVSDQVMENRSYEGKNA